MYIHIYYSISKSKVQGKHTIFSKFFLKCTVAPILINGGTSSFSFSWYPYDMMYNLGHYTSYLTGLLIALAIKLFPVVYAKKYADER